MKLYRGEVSSSHPQFSKGSNAEIQSSALPVETTAPDIVYTKEDDEAIDRFNREIGEGYTFFFLRYFVRAEFNTFFSFNSLAFGMLNVFFIL
jgi:hypothetical protein